MTFSPKVPFDPSIFRLSQVLKCYPTRKSYQNSLRFDSFFVILHWTTKIYSPALLTHHISLLQAPRRVIGGKRALQVASPGPQRRVAAALSAARRRCRHARHVLPAVAMTPDHSPPTTGGNTGSYKVSISVEASNKRIDRRDKELLLFFHGPV